MPTDLPIACTLSAGELPKRLAEMRAIGEAALTSVETTGTRAVLRFRPGAETRERLAAIVAAEADCCAFLGLDLAAQGEELVLSIQAPEDGELVMLELVAAFQGRNGAAA